MDEYIQVICTRSTFVLQMLDNTVFACLLWDSQNCQCPKYFSTPSLNNILAFHYNSLFSQFFQFHNHTLSTLTSQEIKQGVLCQNHILTLSNQKYIPNHCVVPRYTQDLPSKMFFSYNTHNPFDSYKGQPHLFLILMKFITKISQIFTSIKSCINLFIAVIISNCQTKINHPRTALHNNNINNMGSGRTPS